MFITFRVWQAFIFSNLQGFFSTFCKQALGTALGSIEHYKVVMLIC